MMEAEEIASCDLCSALLEMFEGSAKESIVVRSFQSQEALHCDRHAPLIRSFKEQCQPDAYSEERFEVQENIGFVRGEYQGQVTMMESVGQGGTCWDLLLIHEGKSTEDFGKGDVMNPNWVDIAKVKHWKTECLESHGSACENPMKIQPARPRWLVDVEMECVVPGDLDAEFVALSYTYGRHLGLDVSAELITKLQEPYALLEPDIAVRIPPILRHAMFLTKCLEERYLWVDALCIVHESSADTGSELSVMGSIYASAIITIISTDGDAEDGIVGLEGVSGSRKLEQRVISFGNHRILVRDISIFSLISGPEQPGSYFSRAWTYQEHMMAKRKLFFLEKQAHWECQLQQYHEDTIRDATLGAYIEPRLNESLAGFPVLGSLSQIVSSYNRRDLRYPEDALPGITGLLSVLSRSFDGGFLCGIPEMFFDGALAWRPYFSNTELLRRIESGRPKKVQLSPCYLPSWSWVSWMGLIDLGKEASRIMNGATQIQETYQTVEWYTAMSPTAKLPQRRKIRAKWYENREEWKRTGTQTSRWTRIERKTIDDSTCKWPSLWPAGCENSVYRHRDIPSTPFWGPTDDWFFPFPVRKISETMMASMPEQTPYLFCRTQRARVFGRKCDGAGNIIILHDQSNGNVVGTLHLHSKDQLSLFNDTQKGRIHPHWRDFLVDSYIPDTEMNEMFPPEPIMASDLDIEVIAINLTRFHSGTYDKESSSYGKPFYCVEKYHVLWVEWQDGIAYRKAAGLIQKKQWEQLQLEDIDVVLG